MSNIILTRNKIYKAITTIGLIASLFTGVWVFEDRYAKVEYVKHVEHEIVITITQFRVDTIVSQLNQLAMKEGYIQLTKYDKIKQTMLERELELINK